MLKTIFFYIFRFWFIKIKSKKALIVRIVLSAIFMLTYFAMTIVIFIIEFSKPKRDGFFVPAVFTLIFGLLLLVRIADDIRVCNSSEIKENERRQREAKRAKRENVIYKQLIEKCGIKFFIKYYKQIKRLPLRDVEVSENYSSTEREERLLAAKKIIDQDLAEFTLNEILKSYSDILAKNEIEQSKSILAELQSCNNQATQYDKVRPKQHNTAAEVPLYRDAWDE